MTAHADILDQHAPLRGAFIKAVLLHVTMGATFLLFQYVNTGERLGAKDAGGAAVGIQAVESIPLPHAGKPNPVANESESIVPQQPVAKPVKKEKIEKPSPKAVALKLKEKKRPVETASETQKFRPFKEQDPSQIYAKQAPQVANPIFSAAPGSGRIGITNTTLGTRFGDYAQRIQQIVTRNWNTGDVDARLQAAPIVVVRFELQRNGSIRALAILQGSKNETLDYSVRRAIQDSTFPPLPDAYDNDSAMVEVNFELKRN